MGIINKFKLKIGKHIIIDYAVTFGVEFIILVISILLFRIVNIRFETLGFSEFTISKRLIGFLMPLLMLGLGVSLPKFLPLESKQKQLQIHYTAVIIVTMLLVLGSILFLFFPDYCSSMVFGDAFHKKMIFANLLFVYSLMLHACVYNFFRGQFNFKMSGLVQLINLGVLPLICCYFADNMLDYFIVLSVSTIIFLSIINLLQIPLLNFKNLFFKENFIKLTNYGLQRMPGDVVLGLFIALPTFIATNYFSIIEAGNIAFCISLFNIIIAFMSPINIILLPKASKIVFDKDFVQLKRIGGKLLALALSIGIFSIIAINFLAEFVLNIFSISAENNTALYLKIVFTGVIGYSVFSIIRSIIDAFYAKAKNTVNISISFIFFIVSLFTLKFLGIFTLTNTLIVFSISINFLGIITYYSLLKINKLV